LLLFSFENIVYYIPSRHVYQQRERLMKLINIKQLMALTTLSRATIYRKIKEGKLPQPIHPLDTKTSRWNESDILALLQQPTNSKGMKQGM